MSRWFVIAGWVESLAMKRCLLYSHIQIGNLFKVPGAANASPSVWLPRSVAFQISESITLAQFKDGVLTYQLFYSPE